MHPTRRQVLGALAAAGAATLVEPGKVLARLAAEVPCTASAPAGELLGTLPLFRDRSQVQAFGVKYGGAGLDARLVTDLSLLEPGKLITSNELAYIRTEIPAAAAAHTAPGLSKPPAFSPGTACSISTRSTNKRSPWGRTCSNAPATPTPRTSG
ncbi:MAG: hypothetical protein WC815_01340 [Vicinamibacterales bacterium]